MSEESPLIQQNTAVNTNRSIYPPTQSTVYPSPPTGQPEQPGFAHQTYDLAKHSGRYAGTQFKKVLTAVERGNFATWALAIISALLMIFTSFFEIWINVLTLSPITALTYCYCFFFGFVILSLEASPKLMPKSFVAYVRSDALFLTRLHGRAFFYLFVGTLMVAHWHWLQIISGGLLMFTALVMMVTGGVANKKLNNLKREMNDADAVRQKFYQHDLDGNGALDTKEVAALCASLGTVLSRVELESALMLLDANRDGMVSYEEFYNWWIARE
eukprot:CFRG2870T1